MWYLIITLLLLIGSGVALRKIYFIDKRIYIGNNHSCDNTLIYNFTKSFSGHRIEGHYENPIKTFIALFSILFWPVSLFCWIIYFFWKFKGKSLLTWFDGLLGEGKEDG